MEYLFVPEVFLPEGVGFTIYGREHLLWLGVLAVMCAAMVIGYRRMNAGARRRFARITATGLLALELLRDLYIIAAGGWMWCYLPLHPCSFTMFFMVLWAWKPRKVWGNLMYGYGLAGALAALLFCNWTNQPIWQFQTIYSFLFHGMLVGWILMTLIGGDIRPEGRGFLECLVFLAVAAPIATAANYLLPDCNFFFTYSGSEGSPLEVLIRLFGEPWWLIAYALLVAALLAAEFLPWHLADRKKLKEKGTGTLER